MGTFLLRISVQNYAMGRRLAEAVRKYEDEKRLRLDTEQGLESQKQHLAEEALRLTKQLGEKGLRMVELEAQNKFLSLKGVELEDALGKIRELTSQIANMESSFAAEKDKMTRNFEEQLEIAQMGTLSCGSEDAEEELPGCSAEDAETSTTGAGGRCAAAEDEGGSGAADGAHDTTASGSSCITSPAGGAGAGTAPTTKITTAGASTPAPLRTCSVDSNQNSMPGGVRPRGPRIHPAYILYPVGIACRMSPAAKEKARRTWELKRAKEYPPQIDKYV